MFCNPVNSKGEKVFGEILVQMNVEDTRLGVAEYVHEKHGLETIELKWGQGAKCIGGEIKVNSLERALTGTSHFLYRGSSQVASSRGRAPPGTR